jgi:hypothetical protein
MEMTADFVHKAREVGRGKLLGAQLTITNTRGEYVATVHPRGHLGLCALIAMFIAVFPIGARNEINRCASGWPLPHNHCLTLFTVWTAWTGVLLLALCCCLANEVVIVHNGTLKTAINVGPLGLLAKKFVIDNVRNVRLMSRPFIVRGRRGLETRYFVAFDYRDRTYQFRSGFSLTEYGQAIELQESLLACISDVQKRGATSE